MKKLFLAFLLILSFAISGCLNYTQVTTLKIDGSGEMFIHYWVNTSGELEDAFFEKIGLFQKDSIAKEFNSEHIQLDYIEVYNDYKNKTLNGKVKFRFRSIDSLNFTQPFNGANFSFTKLTGDTVLFSQTVQPMTTGFGFEDSTFQVSYIYYIPGKVTFHNAAELSNHKLTWNFDIENIGSSHTLIAKFIPYKLKETPVWIYILAFSVLIIVLIYLFIKKRS